MTILRDSMTAGRDATMHRNYQTGKPGCVPVAMQAGMLPLCITQLQPVAAIEPACTLISGRMGACLAKGSKRQIVRTHAR